MSTLCRLEILTPQGWWVSHAGIALLNPGRYVERLAARNKFGRATELDDRLQPTGTVWEPANLPDPASLVPAVDGSRAPVLPCSLCGEAGHRFEGECLL